MARLKAEVAALVLERRAGGRALELGVAVVGLAVLALDALEGPAEVAHFAFDRITVRLHGDGHLVFGHRAVGAAVIAGRRAEVAVVEKHRAAHGAAADLAGRVADALRAGGDAGLGAIE